MAALTLLDVVAYCRDEVCEVTSWRLVEETIGLAVDFAQGRVAADTLASQHRACCEATGCVASAPPLVHLAGRARPIAHGCRYLDAHGPVASAVSSEIAWRAALRLERVEAERAGGQGRGRRQAMVHMA